MPAAVRPLIIEAPDTAATLRLGAHVADALVSVDPPELVFDLRGELGAGKTVFVRGLTQGLGLRAGRHVVSPTFTIARAYPVTREGTLRELHHVDAYRLRNEEELEGAGFEEMCGRGRVTCVEWGEHVEGALPVDRIRVVLRVRLPAGLRPGTAPECPRAITFEAGGPRAAAVLAALHGILETDGGAA